MMKLVKLWLVLMLLSATALRAETFPIHWVDGKDYVFLRDLAKYYRCEIQGPHRNVITIFNKWIALTFKTDSRELHVNGSLVWLHEPIQDISGHSSVRAVDVRKVIDPLARPLACLKNYDSRVVVIDPGHGGQDTGAKGVRGLEEKRVVFDIARRLRSRLSNAGFTVYMTRESDRFIELDERPHKAENWGADLFVSIHLNSAGNGDACGTETYALTAAGYVSTSGGPPSSALPGNRFEGANTILAYSLQRSLASELGRGDRGLKRARFMVLKNAPCPAALVECAFLSNKKEEELFLQDDIRDKVAEGLARGILNYANTIRRAKVNE